MRPLRKIRSRRCPVELEYRFRRLRKPRRRVRAARRLTFNHEDTQEAQEGHETTVLCLLCFSGLACAGPETRVRRERDLRCWKQISTLGWRPDLQSDLMNAPL